MSSISIIGAGNMARALGARAVEGGNTVEVIGRDGAKAAALATALGGGVTTRPFAADPAGEIVILAVPYASAAAVVEQYGDALSGKVIVDISNPFAAGFTDLLTPDGTSAAQEIAKAAPAGAPVVKAFNTVFGHVLATGSGRGRRLDVLIAGDDARAKADVSAFIGSLGLRALDTGPLAMAVRLEQAGLLMMGLARYGTGHYDFALGITVLD
jgi:8-hydroxy-5-deazaflavin:NADPH oxidoreductase